MNSKWTFSAFQIFFFSMMWVSKTIQPLHFEASHHLANYGLSYSAMALVGYFSFLTGHLSDRWGALRTVGLGGLFYAAGIALRAFPDHGEIAVISGVLAGLGASAVLSSLRMWMLSISAEEERAQWVGIKSATAALGTAVGCAVAGLLPTWISSLGHIQLGVAGLLALPSVFLLTFGAPKKKNCSSVSMQTPWSHFRELFNSHRELVLSTSCIGVLTGFYVSFVSPYLPLIMKEKGLSMSSIGLSIGGLSLIRFFIDPAIARLIQNSKQNTLRYFLAAEAFIFLITGLFSIAVGPAALVAFLVIRCFALGFSTISEELLWLQKFPKDKVGLLFGLNQSAFFIGDFLGGIVNGRLYQQIGLSACVAVALITIVCNAGLFYRLFSASSDSRSLVSVEVLN